MRVTRSASRASHRARHREVRLAGAGRPDAEVDVVGTDRAQIPGLIAPASPHHAAPNLHRLAFAGVRVETLFDLRFLQEQVNPLGRERFLAGRGVQLANDLAGGLDRHGLSEHLEHVSARGDLHPEPVLELPQMLIERAAEACESLVVLGLEEDVGFGACWRHDQRVVSGRSRRFRYGVRMQVQAAGFRTPRRTCR